MKTTISLLIVCLVVARCGASSRVDLVRVPEGGLQPLAALDREGTLHLVYFKGDPVAGDLFHVRRPAGAVDFGAPVRVNHRDHAATAIGIVSGAHLAIGRDGRVHVAWMGSRAAVDKPAAAGAHPEHPMFYTRSNTGGDGFEPERNLMTWTHGLDGGGSVAADASGRVYVAWHGSAPGADASEAGRAMFVAISENGGATFAREVQANPVPTGSCACCGMRAFVDTADRLHLLYRAANPVSRDMVLLTSLDHGRTFSLQTVNRWETQSCPMSTSVMTDASGSLVLATETADAIECSQLARDGGSIQAYATATEAKAKHPALAANRDGEVLICWAEGAGWGQGGRLAWRLITDDDASPGDAHVVGDLPAWSFAAAVALPRGDFLVIY